MLILRAKNRKQAVGVVLTLCVLTGVPVFLAVKGYIGVKRSKAVTVAQETIAYRRELLEKYIDIMMKKRVWGWGHNTWPRVPYMDSIDNQYLLLPIQHGFVSLGFFLAIFCWTGTRLCRQEVRAPRGSQESELALTFFAAYIVIASTLTSVYLGAQTVQLFFLLTGWSEGLLLKMRNEQWATADVAAPSAPLFHFQRVMT
jgi:O-antigen ligase